MTLWTDTEPVDVLGFRAETLGNTTRRDFRLAAGTPGDIKLQPVWWRRRNATELVCWILFISNVLCSYLMFNVITAPFFLKTKKSV